MRGYKNEQEKNIQKTNNQILSSPVLAAIFLMVGFLYYFATTLLIELPE